MTDDRKALKPCPFCGTAVIESDADAVYPINRERTVWNLNCAETWGGCGASVLGDSVAAVIDAWNTRAQPSPDAAQGGEQGEVEDSELVAAKLEYLLRDFGPVRNDECASHIVKLAIAALQNRAPHPSPSGMWLLRVKPKYQQGRGKYERAEHRGYTDDVLHAGRFTEEWAKKCAADCPDKIEAIQDPHPSQAGAEAVDEGMVSVLREDLEWAMGWAPESEILTSYGAKAIAKRLESALSRTKA